MNNLENVGLDNIASRPLEPLKNLIQFAEKVDGKWHESLEWMEKLIAYAQGVFRDVESQVLSNLSSGIWPNISSEEYLNGTLRSISRSSLRTTDAILCLLQTGHPDVALGLTRTLFEYFIDSYLISLDLNGHRARQYIIYDRGHYLEKFVKINQNNENYKKEVKVAMEELKELRKLFKLDSFGNYNQWTKIPGGRHLNSMDEKIKHISKHGIGTDSIDFLQTLWLGANKWAHGSPMASHNPLGTDKTLDKSCTGLDGPMEEASHLLVLVLSVYFKFAKDVNGITGELYNNSMNNLQGIQRSITQSLAKHSE